MCLQVVGIELVKIILLTIPYALVAGGERFHEQAKQLLKNTGIVAGNMVPIESLIHSYVGDFESKPVDYRSVIGLLQAQLSNEAETGFEIRCLPRFDLEALRRVAHTDEEESLPTAPQLHAFPAFTIPSPVNPGPRPVFPEAYFSLFADQEVDTVPKTTDIAASLVRDAIVDTLNQLDFNREIVAKFLVDVDCYWTIGIFAKRGTPFDKFRDVVQDKVQYKSEDMIIDAIFSQLFKLPSAEHKLVYYHSLITQCCKVAPAAIAPSLGRGIRTIYKNLPMMDLELGYRFLDWFSHHLSNFEFRWRWAEWYVDPQNQFSYWHLFFSGGSFFFHFFFHFGSDANPVFSGWRNSSYRACTQRRRSSWLCLTRRFACRLRSAFVRPYPSPCIR